MRVLVIGGGAREHALVARLSSDGDTDALLCVPGNPGIARLAQTRTIKVTDLDGLLTLADREQIDFTIVGPELPLSSGIVDRFTAAGHPILGPTAAAARLESSKAFAKALMARYRVPTARFQTCESAEDALEVVASNAFGWPVVLKADGLAAGKGVVIAENQHRAQLVVHEFMESKILGEAGLKLVIEEFLHGEEASFHVFADGAVFQPMVAAQDHKRRFDGDTGPNTGGMGAYSVDTILSNEQYGAVLNRIIRPTLAAAGSYSGVLYAGLMLTTEGPKLLEYNARFGDPETQVILARLKTDLLDVLVDIAEHRLSSRSLQWSREAAVSVVLVAEGYPGKIETGAEIFGLSEAKRIEGVRVYHAGTRWENGKVYTAGGRVLNVTARGATLAEALDRAYFVAQMIEFEGKDYRKDIGRKGLLKQR